MPPSIKEEFAKFLENPDRTKLRELLKQNTGEYNHLDFKEKWLEPPVIARHILGFANSGGGVLVVGVKEEDNGCFIVDGIERLEDKTQVKSQLQKYLPSELKYEILDFEYGNDAEWNQIKNKKFQVLIVEDTPQYIPFLSLNSSGDILHKNRIYYRGKSNTEEATYEEVKKIINRRLDTNASTTVEDEFKEHLTQLKLLYSFVTKYYTNSPIWMQIAPTLTLLGSLGYTKEKNTKYPEEDFEDFIVRMIQRKKEIIESVMRLK